MFSKYLSLALAVTLVGAAWARPAFAGPGQLIWRADAAKVKAAVAKLGVGKRARAWVILRDKKKVHGLVKEAREDDFVITKKDGTEVAVPYGQVKMFRGDNRSDGKRLALGLVGIGAAVTAVGLILWGASHY